MELLLLFFPLFFIVYEDFRFRAINWIWLALLTIGVAIVHPMDWMNITVNLLLVGVQLLVLTLYFSFKENRLVFLPKQHLGWGDILFYLPLCLLFNTCELIIFLTGSFALTLLILGLYSSFNKRSMPTIPLAGFLSAYLIVLISIGFIQGNGLEHSPLSMIVENILHPKPF